MVAGGVTGETMLVFLESVLLPYNPYPKRPLGHHALHGQKNKIANPARIATP